MLRGRWRLLPGRPRMLRARQVLPSGPQVLRRTHLLPQGPRMLQRILRAARRALRGRQVLSRGSNLLRGRPVLSEGAEDLLRGAGVLCRRARLLWRIVLLAVPLPRRQVRVRERHGLRPEGREPLDLLQRAMLRGSHRRMLRRHNLLLGRLVLQRRHLLRDRDLLRRDHVLQRERLLRRRVLHRDEPAVHRQRLPDHRTAGLRQRTSLRGGRNLLRRLSVLLERSDLLRRRCLL